MATLGSVAVVSVDVLYFGVVLVAGESLKKPETNNIIASFPA